MLILSLHCSDSYLLYPFWIQGPPLIAIAIAIGNKVALIRSLKLVKLITKLTCPVKLSHVDLQSTETQ